MTRSASSSSDHHELYRDAAVHRLSRDSAHDVREQIARLLHHGFLPLPLPNLFASIDGLYLYRVVQHGYIDTVVVRSADCAVAARTHNVFDPTEPLPEQPAVWSARGDLAEVVRNVVANIHASEQRHLRFSGQLDVAPRT